MTKVDNVLWEGSKALRLAHGALKDLVFTGKPKKDNKKAVARYHGINSIEY